MWLVDIAAGFAAGVNVTLVGHPFDTIKVRLQTQPSPPVYTGLLDCVRKTARDEGLRGFYKGVGAPLAGQLFARTSLFTVNNAYVKALTARQGGKPLSYVQLAFGGTVTWTVVTLIEAPLNIAASQSQVERVRALTIPGYTPQFSGVLDYATRAPRMYGVTRALYAGATPHILRNAAGGFLHFGAFELIRREIAKQRGVPVAEVGLAANLFAGGVGGLLYWAPTYPLDVLKSAMQADFMDPQRRKYFGMRDTFAKLWAEGGAARFTRGFSACVARSVPANAVLLTTAFRVREVAEAYIAKWDA